MSSAIRMVRIFVLVGALTFGLHGAPAHAELVRELKSETLYKSNTKISGATTTVATLELETAGVLTVKLKEFCNSLLESLSFELQDSQHQVLASKDGPGVWSFLVSSPTTLFASIFADPEDGAKHARYKIDISYQAICNTPAAVPLPASVLLMFSGLLGLGVLKRKQKLSQIAA